MCYGEGLEILIEMRLTVFRVLPLMHRANYTCNINTYDHICNKIRYNIYVMIACTIYI